MGVEISGPPGPPMDGKINDIPGWGVIWSGHTVMPKGMEGGLNIWVIDWAGKPIEWVKISLTDPWPQGRFSNGPANPTGPLWMYGYTDAEGYIGLKPDAAVNYSIWVEELMMPLIEGIEFQAPAHPEARYTPDEWRIVLVKQATLGFGYP